MLPGPVYAIEFFFSFFVTFFFFLKLFTIEKPILWTIIYKQTKKIGINSMPLNFFFFFCNIFLFKIIYNREAYFINYNLQTNKQKSTSHFTRPSGYWKPTPFAYSPILTLPLLLPDSKAESDKMSKSLGLQNIFN